MEIKDFLLERLSISIFNAWIDNDDLDYFQMLVFKEAIIKEFEEFLDGKRFYNLCQSLSDHIKNDR